MFKVRSITIIFLMVMVIGVGLVACSSGSEAEPVEQIEVGEPAVEDASSVKGEFVIETVPAPSLGDNLIGETTEQTVAIYLPPSYHTSDARFPAVYFLAEVNEPADSWGSGKLLEASMNELLSEGQVEEMILVVPNAGNILGSSSVWANSPVTGNWMDYVAEDLVTYVDANYRTLATPDSRGIAGSLIGGFGAYNLAMYHPDVFGSVYASGPTLFAPNGLEKSWITDQFTTRDPMVKLMEEMAAMTPKAAHERLLEVVAEGPTVMGGTVSYGISFAADVDAGAPYFEYLYLDEETKAPAEVWQRWASGYGDWDSKTEAFKENFASLKAIALSYSRGDQTYVREGTQFASEQLEAAGIEHELHITELASTLTQEVRDLLLPFFSQNLEFE